MTHLFAFLMVVFFIGMAAICSGLNIALVALDPQELKRKSKLGDKRAKKIYPYRKNIHLSLASILFSNALFVSSETLVLGDHFDGIIAALISTLLLVMFGELLPQAFFNKNAMGIVYKFIPLLKLMIILTYVVSKPLQLVLDKWFGHGLKRTLHTRHELDLIIKDHVREPTSELDDDEVEIIRGALQLSEKQVADIMTPMSDVLWIKNTDSIDALMIDKIQASGHSRVPVFSKSLKECYGVLLVKDLLDIDFDDTTLTPSELKLHPTKSIGSRTALDTMFRNFIAARTHLMPVTHKGKIVGIITIEDLLEEIIGHEIIDESDYNLSQA